VKRLSALMSTNLLFRDSNVVAFIDFTLALCPFLSTPKSALKPMRHLKVFFLKPLSKENFQMWHTHLRNATFNLQLSLFNLQLRHVELSQVTFTSFLAKVSCTSDIRKKLFVS